MARPLRVLSLVSRLGVLSTSPSASVNSTRFASRSASKAWTGQSHVHRDRDARQSHDMSDEELGLEEVEDKLQALVEEGRKKQRTVKFHILRRQMTPSGAPQRKLTWDAIEQIRYLKQEQPEEWTVERLAEGFSVRPDVIHRVLRSKFVPPPDRKAKQDAKIMVELSQQGLPSGAGTSQDRPKLPGNHTPAVLPPGGKVGALLPAGDQTLMLRGEDSGSLVKSPASDSVVPSRFRADFNKDAPMTRSAEEGGTTNTDSTEEGVEDEEGWDGQVLTEEELVEFFKMEKPSPAVQVGKDFLDAQGNFLYRI